MKRVLRAIPRLIAILLLLGAASFIGCVQQSGGVWYFHEAGQPPGWPSLTPVGQVQLKDYPAYREAVVADQRAQGDRNGMFRRLFRHIQDNRIAMTAPVDMTYDTPGQTTDQGPRVRSMSFLYDLPERGALSESGDVIVRDVPARRMLSIGVRGSYSDEQFESARLSLEQWLARQEAFDAAGPARYLGYNSPFVPFFWRYGEVQIPVKPRSGDQHSPSQAGPVNHRAQQP